MALRQLLAGRLRDLDEERQRTRTLRPLELLGAEAAGLVRRRRDPSDHRVVHLRLTAKGRRRIERLSKLHLEELRRLAPLLVQLDAGATGGSQPPGG